MFYGSEGSDESQRGHHRAHLLGGPGRPAHQPHNVGALPVCGGDGRLRGMVTDRDIVLRCVAAEEDPAQTLVRDIMTRGCATVSPRDDCRAATRLMAQQQVRRPACGGGGQAGGHDLPGRPARCGRFDMEAAQALCEISENIVTR